MGNRVKRVGLLFLLCATYALACHADWFKGKVVNAETGEPLANASVNSDLNSEQGWKIHNSTETDSTGCFVINSNWEGRIIFTFSNIGYKKFRKVDYSYGKEVKDTTDLGIIKLSPTTLMMKEVEVKANIPRITMQGDTIVFHPEAFKLKEGDRLDKLIKKLPGVENRDGKLYWDNKPIRLMMNGKNVFGGDQIINELPAEVAKNIKLYNRKSELARHTGQDDGTEDNVLDIQIKPGFLDKWYGIMDAYYQTTDRYMFDVTANKLSDHDPQMVYLQANNRNRYIDKVMRMSMDRNIDCDGKSQYGSYNYEHNWLTKGAEALSNNRFDISANMGHSDGWGTETTSTETFFPNEDRTMSLSSAYNNDHTLTPQLSSKLFAYTDTANSVQVDVTASYEKTRGINNEEGASYSFQPDQFQYYPLATAMGAKPGDPLYEHLVTRNRNYQRSDGDSRNLTASYAWTHYLGKKGSFSVSGNTVLGGENDDKYLHRQLEYLREGRMEDQWQRYDYTQHNLETHLEAAFDYWLTKHVYFYVSDNVGYTRQRSQRNVFADTYSSATNEGGAATTPDPDNLLDATTRTWINQLTVKSTIRPAKGIMLMPQFDWTLQHDDAAYRYGQLDTTAVRNSQLFAPSFFLKWKINRAHNLDLRFAYSTTVPEINQTFAFRNTIDPLTVSTGNAMLRNTHSHTTAFAYHRLWLRKQIVLSLNASYTKNINPLGTLFSYNTLTGVYTYKPVNVKGGDQWEIGVNYDQGLGADFRLMNKLSLTTSQAYGYLTLLENDREASSLPALNRQKRFGLDNQLEFSYEVEKLQMALYDNLNWSRYRYDASAYNTHPLENSLGMYATISLGQFEIWLKAEDKFRSGYQTTASNGHRILANGYVSYKFCKNKCSLMLYVQDIFNKDILYYTDYNAYRRQEVNDDMMHHYAYLKFTYRFDAKEQKRKKK